jgi:hypothetical protein
MPHRRNHDWNRLPLVLVLLLLLLPVPSLQAVVQPEGKSVDRLAFAHPDLFQPSDAKSLDKLPSPLAERLREDLRILARGRDGGPIRFLSAEQAAIPVALYNVRAGRWESLLLSRPLIPGTGVGNDLTWSGIRVARPPDDERLKNAVWEAFRSYLTEFRDQLGIDPGDLSAIPEWPATYFRRST